jgi:tubulin-specific chaperone D
LNTIRNLVKISQENCKNERLITSLIKTIDLILQYNLLNDDELINEDIPTEFFNVFLENCRKSSDIQKIMTFIDFLCDMLQFKDRLKERCMIQLMIMLCHKYPRIRRTAAGKLYESLLNDPDIVAQEENLDEAISLLTETDWDQSLDIVKPIRNRLCDLTNTPKPVPKTKSN